MNGNSGTPSAPKRRLHFILKGLIALAIIIALFYTEEDVRGWLAMKKCQHELEAQGVKLDWKSYIPAPVPDDENVFGVPEMKEAFIGRGAHGIAKTWPERPTHSTRMVIAQLTIGLPGTVPPAESTLVQWGNPKMKEETRKSIKEALGPVALDPVGGIYTKRDPADIRPAHIFLQCQAALSESDLQQLVPSYSLFPNQYPQGYGDSKIQLERSGDGSYNITMQTPATAAEFLKSCQPMEPDFAMIRQALQRPYAQINGDYSDPTNLPIAGFVSIRTIVQRLGAMAECHFILGQPDEALRDLTFLHDICRRVLEENKPMTMVSAMIDVAVRGLQAGVLADGLQMHALPEAQLATLQLQLKQINLLGAVAKSFEFERAISWSMATKLTPEQLKKLNTLYQIDPKTNGWQIKEKEILWSLIPRGWNYQNLVTGMNLFGNINSLMDSDHGIIFPSKAKALRKQADAAFSHGSPYSFLAQIMVPNFSRAFQITAMNQTQINQALIVCGLERYRLAHGEYPDNLAALTPQFVDAIPHDLIGGQPPHYSRNSDGTFLLYSIGWSETDHGGHAGNSWNDQDNSDMVWPPKY